MIERTYNIYVKQKCIYESLSEDEFNKTWSMIKNFLSLIGANVRVEYLTYEEVNSLHTIHNRG